MKSHSSFTTLPKMISLSDLREQHAIDIIKFARSPYLREAFLNSDIKELMSSSRGHYFDGPFNNRSSNNELL